MRVLLTSGIYPPDIGGPATYIPKFAKYISERNPDVKVVSLRPAGEIEPIKSYRLRLIKRRFFPLRILNTIQVVMVQSVKSDRIFSNGLYLEAALAARVFKKPAVAKIVGDPIWERARNNLKTELPLMEFQSARLSFRNNLLRRVYKFTFNSFSHLTCPSEELVEIVKLWGVSSPVICIPNGVTIPEKSFHQKDFDLIFVGRLVAWKNVDLLIQLAADLKLKTIIIGGGPEALKLESLASSLGADCLFTGELDKGEILDYMNRSKLFALFSQYEGLSFALLEAMAAGLPTLVSNTPGNLAVVSDNYDSLVVDLNQITDSYSRILSLIQDPDRLDSFGQNSRSKVQEKYELRLRLEDMYQLIESAS
jgi:glycosyltransferase involved in cell wall biosynthesis